MRAIEEAKEVLSRYFAALRSQDSAALKKCFHADATMTYVGTDREEAWVGWSEAGPNLESQVEIFERVAVNRDVVSMSILAGDNAIYFLERDEMVITSGGKRHEVPVRLTGVIERREGRWAISHFHRSIGQENQAVRYTPRPPVRF